MQDMVNVYAVKLGNKATHSGVSEAFVRHIAMYYAGIQEADIVFNRTPEGKPYLERAPNFHFNLSHSGQWLVCATHTQPVGIDIEQVVPLDILQYREHLSPAEYYALRALPAREQLDHFYELWTLKESYLKQTGMGLSIPMSSFTVRQQNGAYALLDLTCNKQTGIFFKQYDIEDGHKMAVCGTRNLFAAVQTISREEIPGLLEH